MFGYFLKPFKSFRRSYLAGVITASADDDPSTVSTYSVVGATTGFSQLWLLLLSTPLLIVIHRMIARIGDIAKKGLITLIKENFGRRSAFVCLAVLLAVNLLTLVADIVGMAAGFQLLTGENYLYFIVPLIILVWYVLVFDTYGHIIRYFFWVSGVLVAYILAGILAKPDWGLIVKSVFWPPIKANVTYFAAALGLLGATFSPFTFIWQTEEEIEERHNANHVKKTDRAVTLGFFYSNLVAFFIIVASAVAIANGRIDWLSVKDIAQALTPIVGGWATKLFGIGLIGSGILAIPILAASSAYAAAEFFAWPEGLRLKPRRAKGFYAVITFGFAFCLASLLFNINPIKAMFFSQVLVGFVTPLIIYFILRIAGNRKIMGNYRSRWPALATGWLTVALLVAGDAFLIYFLL
jgi:Mn2+/Fe2+ NRAMP family transporter